MSCHGDNCCKQRFKGAESFLRRVAFNLGNTPSQTEVKIISCIPIDVTDLQQKIIQLEKQLETVNRTVQSTTSKRTSLVHTAIGNPPMCQKISNTVVSNKGLSRQPSVINYSTEKKSTISYVYPTRPSQQQECRFSTDVSAPMKPNESPKNFFHKKKVFKRNKCKTHMVYYSQTDDITPFNNYGLPNDETLKNRDKKESSNINRSYLTDMVHKQYIAARVPADDINASEFSTPVCRDINPFANVRRQSLESYNHSCCHGYFQNIDNHISEQNRFDVFPSHRDSGHSYYDSNLYDLVPVKEKSANKKNKIEISNRKDTKNLVNIACYPENIRPRQVPVIVNYQTAAPKRKTLIKMMPAKHQIKKEMVLNKMAKMRPILTNAIKPQMGLEAEANSVELGKVYTKRLTKNKQKINKPNPSKYNNTPCTPDTTTGRDNCTVSNTDLQVKKDVISYKDTATAPKDQTEETLNQIKSILQTVLTEVKAGNVSGQAKKDAIVQNGQSQSNLVSGSQLLQSFTYSPFNMNLHGASCSRQIPPSNVCYPHVPYGPFKFMQYPLLTQPPHNMCTSCYRNNPPNKLPCMKRATSASTNTEQPQVRSKETENLIKEIYQSLALNIDIPVRGTTEHGDFKESNKNQDTKKQEREAKHIAKAISEIFKSNKPIETSVTHNSNTPLASKITSNETSLRSNTVRNYRTITRKKMCNYSDNSTQSNTIRNENDRANSSCLLETDEESDNTIVNERATESSSSDTDSEDATTAVDDSNKKKEKNSIFSKMLKIFKPRRKNKKDVKEHQTSDSDSDDYQTVYSQQVTNRRPAPKTIRSKAHSKVFQSKLPQQMTRNHSPGRSPNIDRESRRYINDNLAFHRHQYKHPTPVSQYVTNPVYYHNMEARNTSVNSSPLPRMISRESGARTESKGRQCARTRSSRHQHQVNYKRSNNVVKFTMAPKGKAWLKKHNLGLRCGQQWKKLVLEG